MSDEQNDNQRTLRSYQDKTQEYIDRTPVNDATILEWLDEALALMPAPGTILEVGSGFGRDAKYIRSKGYDIECSDAVPNFVELLRAKGFNARMLNLLTDAIGGNYDMIIANAVLLHFNPEETMAVCSKIYDALTNEGVFAVRMKAGNGPRWSDEKLDAPRYFYDWQQQDLKLLFEECGFHWVSVRSNFTAHNNVTWMDIILKKK